jgi:hypothetical protein
MKNYPGLIIFLSITIIILQSCQRKDRNIIYNSNDTIIKTWRSVQDSSVLGTETYVSGKLTIKTHNYDNGKTDWKSFYNDGEWTGETWHYTREGHLAVKDLYIDTLDKWGNKHLACFTKIVFYQKSPFAPDNYSFVSDTGFYMVRDFKKIEDSIVKPDNIMETESKGIYLYYYVWRNGKKYFIRKSEMTL